MSSTDTAPAETETTVVEDDAKPKSPIAAAMSFFGKKAGQNLASFKREWDELSPGSQKQLADGIRDGSLTY